MPDFAIDTSTYPKLNPPNSGLDTASKVIDLQRGQQALQSGGLTIDKQKLDLVNQRFDTMAKDFTSLMSRPDLNEDAIRNRIQTDVKLGIVTPEMAGTFITQLPPTQGMKPAQAAATLKDHLGTWLNHAQTIKEAIDTQFGTPQTREDNANVYSGVQQSPIQGGKFIVGNHAPIQVPPTQTNVNNNPADPNYLQPGIVGPSGPPGFTAAQPQNNLPVASPNNPAAVPMPQPRPRGLPIASPAVSGPTGPTVNNGTEFNNRFDAAFPNKVVTGAPPGVAGAISAVKEQSGKDYATALTNAGNLGVALQPDLAVLDIVKGKGPGDFGPGTDKLNQLKKLAVTWLPNVDPKLINDSSDYDTVKKYLVQGARASGNTGSNDQLAAAFEGSPNTTMNTATIESIVKSRVALKKMEAAEALMFQKTGLDESQFSKWKAKNQNQFDPRAFGFDMMDEPKQTKLLDSFTEKENDSSEMKKAKAKAYTKFRDTLQFAHDAALIGNNQ